MYSQIDVTQPTYPVPPSAHRPGESEPAYLLRALVAGQQRQNELLQQLVSQLSAAQRQRQNELGQWKQNNPRLARSCRAAAEALGKVQTEFLDSLTQEIHDSYENLLDGEFMLNEFIPLRSAHGSPQRSAAGPLPARGHARNRQHPERLFLT